MKRKLKYDKIYQKVGLNMNNKNVLLCTAMLTTIWEKHHKDNIDMVSPFVIYILSELYSNDMTTPIDQLKVLEYLDKDYGFSNFPVAVLIKIFNRLTKDDKLKKEDGKYYLKANLENERKTFESNKINSQKLVDDFLKGLSAYLKENCKSCKSITVEQCNNYFINFLEKNGYGITKDRTNIKFVLKTEDNPTDYYIAKYISELSENGDKAINMAITKIIDGLYISKVIYFDYEADIEISSKLKDSVFYFDTGIMLQVLGLKTTAENLQGKYLLESILSMNGSVKCFEHVLQEVDSIIVSYINCKFIRKRPMWRTLEHFDENSYTKALVESFRTRLRSKIGSLKIEIVDTPDYGDIEKNLKNGEVQQYIDEDGLAQFLENKIQYKNKEDSEQLSNDVKSIASIFILRKGKKCHIFEKSKAIFLTNNKDLTYFTNSYLGELREDNVPPIMNDIDCAAILWLKTYSLNAKSRTYPKLQLIQNAVLALEPNSEFIHEFTRVVDLYEKEEKISCEEADLLRNDFHIKRDIMAETEGCVSKIEDTFEYCKDRYLTKFTKELNEKAAVERKAIYRKLEEKEEEDRATKERISKYADEVSAKKADRLNKALNIILGIAFLIMVYFCIKLNFDGINFEFSIEGGFSVLIIILSIIDMISPRMKNIQKIKNKKVKEYSDNIRQKIIKQQMELNPKVFK